MDFGQASSGQDNAPGGGAMRRTGPAWGLAQLGGNFCPWRPLEVVKPWQTRTFAAAEFAPSNPKVILGAKNLDPIGL